MGQFSRTMQESMHRPQTPVVAKIYVETLLHCTDHLLAVYDAMPIVNAMGDYINGKYGGNGFPRSTNSSSNSYEVGSLDEPTSIYPKCIKRLEYELIIYDVHLRLASKKGIFRVEIVDKIVSSGI